MKKKLLSLLLVAAMVLGLVACGGNTDADKDGGKKEDGKYELALVTDVGTIDDKSFNQGAWEGLVQYAEENNITHQYYKPVEASNEAYEDSIALAVAGGAKVIVLPGFLFEVPAFNVQTQYPDVTFILIDGEPHTEDYKTYKTESNTLAILFAEEQAGYLAGYAAVTDGYTKLGFMGGMAVPAVIRYGYGFVQGANAAAEELGLADGAIELKYNYLGDFNPSPDHNTKAAAWYTEGTEIIFAAAGGAGNSVMQAAETAGKAVIGVDVDQSSESDTVVTSAMKNLGKAVYDAITEYYDGTFKGGRTITLNASNEGVELPMSSSKLTTFNKEKYDDLYAKLANGSVQIKKDTDAEDATKLDTPKVKVTILN